MCDYGHFHFCDNFMANILTILVASRHNIPSVDTMKRLELRNFLRHRDKYFFSVVFSCVSSSLSRLVQKCDLSYRLVTLTLTRRCVIQYNFPLMMRSSHRFSSWSL